MRTIMGTRAEKFDELHSGFIRGAQPQDAAWLGEKLRALFDHALLGTEDIYLRHCLPGSPEALTQWFAQEISGGRSIIYVAEIGKQLVGFIRGSREQPYAQPSSLAEIGYLSLIWVEPGYRRRGVARLLVDRLENHFRDLNIRYVDLHYLLGNQQAEQVWSKLGYVPYRIAARKELAQA